jgi:hypothetical protein
MAVLETGELFVGIAGPGDPTYEFVYRAAAGVYWDATMRGFRSTPLRDWSASRWYAHIVAAVQSELGVRLKLGNDLAWGNLSQAERDDISNLYRTA